MYFTYSVCISFFIYVLKMKLVYFKCFSYFRQCHTEKENLCETRQETVYDTVTRNKCDVSYIL